MYVCRYNVKRGLEAFYWYEYKKKKYNSIGVFCMNEGYSTMYNLSCWYVCTGGMLLFFVYSFDVCSVP